MRNKISERSEPRGSLGRGKGGALSLSPGNPLSSLRSAIFFLFNPVPFSPTAEPGPRLACKYASYFSVLFYCQKNNVTIAVKNTSSIVSQTSVVRRPSYSYYCLFLPNMINFGRIMLLLLMHFELL